MKLEDKRTDGFSMIEMDIYLRTQEQSEEKCKFHSHLQKPEEVQELLFYLQV